MSPASWRAGVAPAPGDRACPGCGQVHPAARTEVVIGAEALDALVAWLDEHAWEPVVVVSDANTDEAVADTLSRRLATTRRRVTRCRFPERAGLAADEEATETARAALRAAGPDGALVAGSGTLNDITRFATHLESLDYLSVPTAASMDGYASSVAAMQFDGLKVSFSARAPLGIFADTRVLAAAPAEMTSWGLGDLLGKATARFDWLLSEAVTGEPYCPVIAEAVAAPLERCTRDPEGLLAGDEEGISTLAAGLVESGLAMAMAGSSRPASGSEHHCSHFWDLLAHRGLRGHAPHGLQVAHATAAILRLQLDALDRLEAGLSVPPGRRSTEEDRWLGESADSEQVEKVRREKAELWEAYAPRWPPPPSELADARRRLESASEGFPRVRSALRALGIPPDGSDRLGLQPFELDPETLEATLRFANRMRPRFSVLDLLESQGRLDTLARTTAEPRG